MAVTIPVNSSSSALRGSERWSIWSSCDRNRLCTRQSSASLVDVLYQAASQQRSRS